MNVAEIRNEFKEKIDDEIKIGFEGDTPEPDMEEELEDVYESGVGSRE
jgi:hypothetical protein